MGMSVWDNLETIKAYVKKIEAENISLKKQIRRLTTPARSNYFINPILDSQLKNEAEMVERICEIMMNNEIGWQYIKIRGKERKEKDNG